MGEPRGAERPAGRARDVVAEELYTREYLDSGRGSAEYSPYVERANLDAEVQVQRYDETDEDKLKRRGLMAAFGLLAAALPAGIFLLIWNLAG